MRREKWFLAIGFVIGGFLSVVLLLWVAPRYTVIHTEDTVLKQDTWSGKSWCLVNESWKPLSQKDEGWVEVDRALSKALNITYAPVDIEEALRGLRGKYPVLKDVPTKELLERIKVVYSNKLLCSLYLKSFMEVHGDQGGGGGT
jgi:hypothetical protein